MLPNVASRIEFMENLTCLRKWSRNHAERVCWKEFSLIKQRIPNSQTLELNNRRPYLNKRNSGVDSDQVQVSSSSNFITKRHKVEASDEEFKFSCW